MALSSLWESLNDKCWPLLEAIRLDGAFDKYNLPPILFPLAIILLVIVLLLAFSGPGAPIEDEPYCGDGICQPDLGEDSLTCPEDCGTQQVSTRTVTVRLDRTPECEVEISLLDVNGGLLNKQKTRSASASFPGIDVDSVSVSVKGPYQDLPQTTPARQLEDGNNEISLSLSATACEAPSANVGTLRLTIKDAYTGIPLNGVSISIAEIQNGVVLAYQRQNVLVNGQQDFSLPLQKSYALYAEKEGYLAYDGNTDSFSMSQRPYAKTIQMTPIEEELGDFEVCVRANGQALTEGILTVNGINDIDFILRADLSQSSPDIETTDAGCYVFTNIPSGKVVTASMNSPPPGCVPQSSPSVTISPARLAMASINLDCEPGSMGMLRVSVLINGTPITQEATITVWQRDGVFIPGNGVANSLAMGSEGYTEEVSVPANTSLYVWVRGLPMGYMDYKSEDFIVLDGQRRSIDIIPEYTEPDTSTPSTNFSFSGVTHPSILERNQSFELTISEITFEETSLGANSDVKVYAAGELCNLSYADKWTADCRAPSETGEYDISIQAKHAGNTGRYASEFEVRQYAPGAGLITITPIFTTHGKPPLELYYEIEFNGSLVTHLTNQSTRLTYLNSPGAYAGEAGELSLVSGYDYWSLTADVPYKGEYRLTMTVEVFSNGVFYEASYAAGFTATEHSSKLRAEVHLSDRVLTPSQVFTTDIILTFDGRVLPNLEIVEAFYDSVFHMVPWQQARRLYSLNSLAPPYEICTTNMRFLINGLEIAPQESIHIINTGGTTSISCPLDRGASCNSIEDVRKCILNHQDRLSYYEEAQLMTCVTSGCGLTVNPTCASNNKGDLEPDCMIDEVDVYIAEEWLGAIRSQTDRNALSPCLDMNNDEVVNDADLECLRKMRSGSWYGDIDGAASEPGICTRSMKGGFCFDISTSSPLPGDMVYDGKIDQYDVEVMENIITATSAGVTPHEEMLAVADFNQDGRLDLQDLKCLEYFMAVDFSTGYILPTSATIPVSCMNIFDLGCRDIPGDLNGDGELDILDLIFMRLIIAGQLDPYSVFTCADINHDNLIDQYDLECLEAYISGDEQAWLHCFDCDGSLPFDYWHNVEICNDGWDNDCDGLKDDQDPRCACTPDTPCDMKWDLDGGSVPGLNDSNYMTCANFGEGYGWYRQEEINENCNSSTEWNGTYMCGNDVGYTCVFKYLEGFAYPNNVSQGSFGWLEGDGNIGPLGIATRCTDSGHPSCAIGWNRVGTSGGNCNSDGDPECKDCGNDWDRYEAGKVHHCSFCRFEYDFCQDLICGSSGTTMNDTISDEYSPCAGQKASFTMVGSPYGTCTSNLYTYTGPALDWCSTGWSNNYAESCSFEDQCMGLI
jgi:hypothetical protein